MSFRKRTELGQQVVGFTNIIARKTSKLGAIFIINITVNVIIIFSVVELWDWFRALIFRSKS